MPDSPMPPRHDTLLESFSGGIEGRPVSAQRATISMAISAKRQADALERIAKSLETIAGETAHPEYGIAPTLRSMQRG